MLYYIQDTRTYVGNSMSWWRKEGHGYTCDIREAELFTLARAEEICRTSHFKMWPRTYIDSRVSHHIDMQTCDPEVAMQELAAKNYFQGITGKKAGS